ncbi:MAG: PKD domain-containing protein [Bacteroidota bacterium]
MKQSFKYLVVCVTCVCVSLNLNAQSGPPWVKTTLPFNYIMRGIDFPNNQDMIGYMAGESLTYNGNGVVLKTTDGGASWVQKWTGTNMGVEGSCFVDENTGFVAGWPKLSGSWSGFGKTTDGGDTWTSPAVTPDVYYFTDVVFKDANNGILLGATNTAPLVYVTNNGGTSWTSATGVSNGVPAHACHVSGNKYFLVDNAGHIKKSVDNGLTWTNVFTVPGGLMTGVDFFSDNIGMACGDNGLIVKTSDGGLTWQVQQAGTDIWHDFGWQNQDHVFVIGTPAIGEESTNGGGTWVNGLPGSPYQAALYECIFTANGTGFICGSQGTLYKRMPSCTAAFSASQTGVCTGHSVTFTSQSIGNISTYDWFFEGGTPSTSNNQNPVVTYNTPGAYDVKLVVNNGYWSDTLVKANFITVTDPATPVITLNGYLLSSNIPAGNQWYRNGTLIAGATGQTHTATLSGWYWDVVTQNGCASDTSNNIQVVIQGVNEPEPLKVRAYQVPGTGSIRLDFAGQYAGVCDLTVFNCKGMRIFEKKSMEMPANGEADINPGNVAGGLFILVLQQGEKQVMCKILMNK